MFHTISVQTVLAHTTLAVLLVLGLFLASLRTSGPREVSPLESIRGIPFVQSDGRTQVYEELAHADIYLREPVLAKALRITVSYIPHSTEPLRLGIRENAFWLSYNWQTLGGSTLSDEGRRPAGRPASNDVITDVITFALTDKLQERDRSLDLMFLAGNSPVHPEPMEDATYWELVALDVEAIHATPTMIEVKDFAHSILTRERAL